MQRVTRHWPLLALCLITVWLRLANLGYSNFQGDEIKALAQPTTGQSGLTFLLEQRKGPIQFLITRLIYLINPSNHSEFVNRLPFALAGVLAVLIFYAFLKLHTDKTTALFAALFMATNGLFVALNRIVQYQAFLLFFSTTTLYAFSLAVYKPAWKIKGIYFGFVFLVLAVFSHYDGIFITPMVAYLLFRWYRNNREQSKADRLWRIGVPAVTGVLILAAYYLLLLRSASPDTQSYWLVRLFGIDQGGQISSSVVTFQIYNPLFVLPIYFALGLCSLLEIRKALPFLGWFLALWAPMELLSNDPGTHIYTYILPVCVLAGLGLKKCTDTLRKIAPGWIGNGSGLVLPILLFGGLFGLSHLIFVDHSPEYPWEARGLFIWKIERPGDEYKLWLFGFPYFRHWREIGDFITSSAGEGAKYLTNEKETIAEYYLPPLSRSANPDIYIHISHPQSLNDRLANQKIRYWVRYYPPDKVFKNGGQIIAEIYLLPHGTLDEIRSSGY